MSIAQSEFWSRLVQSGLADSACAERYRDAFAQTNDGLKPADTKMLAGFLVRIGVLTNYQVAKLLGPRGPNLQIGSFVMSDDQPVPPFSHWIPVQTPVTVASPNLRRGFLLRVPLAGLDEARRSWLAAHSEIHGDSLQSFELSGGAQSQGADQTVEIFSPLPEGRSLRKVVETRVSLGIRKSLQIGIDLANALTAMHTPNASGWVMAHGAVGADHVWVTPQSRATLLRDPSSPARSPLADLSTSWIDRLETPALYAAPELAVPASLPTPASDIYSLGCLLFTLLFGRPAYSGRDAQELMTAHCEALPPELIEAVGQGAAGHPVLRVLAYAMAKDPAARFESAAAMAEALKRAGELIDSDEMIAPTARNPSPVNAVPQSAAVPPQVAAPDPTVAPTAAPTAAPTTAPTTAPTVAPAPKNPKQSAASTASAPQAQPAETPRAVQPKPDPAKPTPKKAAGKKSAGKKSDAKRSGNRVTAELPLPAADAPPRVVSEPSERAPQTGAHQQSPPRERILVERDAGSHDETASDSRAATIEAPPELVTAESERIAAMATATPTAPPPDPHQASQLTLRKRRKRRKNRIPILAGMMVLPLLMLGLAIALRGRGPVERPSRPRPKPSIVGNVPRVPDSRRDVAGNEPTLVNGYEIVDSDRLLWVPPYAADSPPPSLELLPPGPAVILSVRLADIIDSDDAKPVLETFAGEIEPLIVMVEQRAGLKRGQIQRFTASLFPGKDGWPEVALAIDAKEPVALSVLTKQWDVSESRDNQGSVLYAGEDLDGDAYYIGGGEKGKPPEDGNVTRFAVASLTRIREVAENEGAAIPLARSLQTLWSQTSSQCDLVVMATPNFLFADGREILASTMPEFRGPLKQWLIPDIAALSLAVSARDAAIYVELRELPSGGATSATLLKSFRESLLSWPDWADGFILGSVPDPSWRLLASRLPLMLRFVSDQTRSTILGESVVASAYLPADAGTQVILATFLAMNTAHGGSSLVQEPETPPLTVDEMLDRPMSISFLQLSLQFAVDAVVEEFKPSLPAGSTMPNVRIIGSDLEKNGITQNQQIRGFERNDQPLRKVLTDLVLGANPDKTATGPTDPKQSLVWVVHPQGKSPAETEILITTRDAAAGRYELPEEFRIADSN